MINLIDQGTSPIFQAQNDLAALAGPVEIGEESRIIRGLLVEVGIKDGHFMGPTAKRREIGEKRPENRAKSQIIARRRSHPGPSDSDQSPQLAENKGDQEH